MSETGSAAAAPLDYDIVKILKALPHRYPLLLVDRVKAIQLGERIHAVKAVSMNEQFFQGHFPGRPIMPGVLIIEAMAQTAGVICMKHTGGDTPSLVYFMTIDNAKFRVPVEPGCLLHLDVEFTQKRPRVCKFKGTALVNDQVAAEAEFMAMIADPPKDAE